MTEYYRTNLEDGLEFQDWVCDQLRKSNPALIIGPYSSKRYQQEKGESFSGVEIKNDKRLAGSKEYPNPTHNVYFEVAEKSNASISNYTPSGIKRKDNGWLYLIGNYEEVFLFSTKQLLRLYDHPSWYKAHSVLLRQTPTSIGFTMPRSYILSDDCPYLLNHWVFDEESIKKHHPGQIIK